MAIFTTWLRAALDALLGAAVTLVNDWRRDRALRDLGRMESDAARAEADRQLEEEVREVSRRIADRDDTAGRMRDGTF